MNLIILFEIRSDISFIIIIKMSFTKKTYGRRRRFGTMAEPSQSLEEAKAIVDDEMEFSEKDE